VTATIAVRGARRAASPVAVGLGLWIAAAVVSGFTIRRSLEGFDEGFLLQAATRIADGQWPWRDFGWPYGPGQPLVVAGAFKLLGPSVLWWRLLRVVVDATTALLAWALVRERAGDRPALAVGAAAALTAAQPVSANAANPALMLGLLAVWLASRRRPGWAGAAAAVAVFWRPDLGAAAALAAAATAAWPRDAVGEDTAVARRARPVLADDPARALRAHPVLAALRGRPALVVLGAAAAAALVLYAPFLVAVGPGKVFDALVLQSTRDGAWWRLPFPSGYSGQLRAGHLARDLKDVLGWLEPYVALAGSALAVVVLGRRRAAPGLAILALGCVAYLLSRADELHAQLLLIVACPLLALGIAAAPRLPAALLGVALALIAAGGLANRLSALLRPPDLVAVHLPGVPGIGVPPAEARALPPLIALVDRLVGPGQPIYVAPRRSDLVTSTNPLVHFLVRRPNVLHRDVLLQARPGEQQAIVVALRRARPRVVVRWTSPQSAHPEPNPRGRPSGSRELDAYLAAAYRLRARFGDYDVLVPRG
jgi:hypothetical protein